MVINKEVRVINVGRILDFIGNNKGLIKKNIEAL